LRLQKLCKTIAKSSKWSGGDGFPIPSGKKKSPCPDGDRGSFGGVLEAIDALFFYPGQARFMF
jgi:hypothetical protein